MKHFYHRNILRWVLENHLFWGQKVKGQGHESRKHCRRGSLYCCECWLILLVGLVAGRSVAAAAKKTQNRTTRPPKPVFLPFMTFGRGTDGLCYNIAKSAPQWWVVRCWTRDVCIGESIRCSVCTATNGNHRSSCLTRPPPATACEDGMDFCINVAKYTEAGEYVVDSLSSTS